MRIKGIGRSKACACKTILPTNYPLSAALHFSLKDCNYIGFRSHSFSPQSLILIAVVLLPRSEILTKSRLHLEEIVTGCYFSVTTAKWRKLRESNNSDSPVLRVSKRRTIYLLKTPRWYIYRPIRVLYIMT